MRETPFFDHKDTKGTKKIKVKAREVQGDCNIPHPQPPLHAAERGDQRG
jgi:hypothetical protein